MENSKQQLENFNNTEIISSCSSSDNNSFDSNDLVDENFPTQYDQNMTENINIELIDDYFQNPKYTPPSFKNEQIICLELMNNNKIYINYSSDWTVLDVHFLI